MAATLEGNEDYCATATPPNEPAVTAWTKGRRMAAGG